MTLLGTLLGLKDRFRWKGPSINVQGPCQGVCSGTTHRLSFGSQGAVVGVVLIPKESSGAEASFRPLTWQLVCCASI